MDDASKHEIENAIVAITQLSQAVSPLLNKMADYIKQQAAYEVVSPRQIARVQRSMQALCREANRLSEMVKKWMKQEGQHD